MKIPLSFDVEEFDWDANNIEKNRERHQVEPGECEEVFFNQPLLVAQDQVHSIGEERYHALGHSNTGRKLLIVFTVRGKNLRVISARDMSRKERTAYETYGNK